MIYSDNTFDITNNIATYARRDFKSVFDTMSNKWYMLNNLNNYEEYGIYGDSFDTYYTGKLVIVNNREYEWNGTEWVDLGEVTGEQRNVKFSEYFPDQASFTTKTINNVHWDMSKPAATINYEDVFFSYDGPNNATSSIPRFSMYYNNGVYTDTGFSDRKILQLPQDSDGYYYYNFSGEMYLSNRQSSFDNYLNYTTWNYAYTFVDTIRYPKYYTEKAAPLISTLWASTIYRNSAHLTTLMRNDVEQAIWSYMEDDILKKGEVPLIDYLCFEAIEAGTVKFEAPNGFSQQLGEPNLEYSFDKNTWTTLHVNNTVSIQANDKIYFRGQNPNGFTYGRGADRSGTTFYINCLFSTNRYNISGNIMTLIDKTGQTTTIPNAYCFSNLFSPELTTQGANNGKVVSAINLKLPATTLQYDCYRNLFNGNQIMTTPPQILPAMTLTDYCYANIFLRCSNLLEGPILPAQALTTRCYDNLFNGCAALKKIVCYAISGINSTNTGNWVLGVASTGDFYKGANVSWPRGAYGIPSGWTVHTSL